MVESDIKQSLPEQSIYQTINKIGTNKTVQEMESMNETKTRRPRRSKADIESAIMRAAIVQIKKKGFSMALVTDIVKRAKIEPIVFYNRYKNLEEFYDSFVKRFDYWISDLMRGINGNLYTEAGYGDALEKLLRNLIGDAMMTELLRWEISEGTTITERTARLREIDCTNIISQYGKHFADQDIDIVAITALSIAGIYYMVLHKDRSTFGGIDINTEEGIKRLSTAIRKQASLLLHANKKDGGTADKLKECLREEGLSDSAIERCIEKMGWRIHEHSMA